jgi:hypothetical protein
MLQAVSTEKEYFDLLIEPSGELYRRLIDFAASRRSLALLVVRPDMDLSVHGEMVLSDLQPFTVERVRSSKWPGTELLVDDAEVIYFRLLPDSAKILQDATQNLYAWCQPDLPEDLCFLSEDREPWLITIAHEQEGYLRLNEWERRRLERALPDLKLTRSREDAG